MVSCPAVRISGKISLNYKEISTLLNAKGIGGRNGAFGKRQVVNGIQQVGFAAAIVANEAVEAGGKTQGGIVVILKKKQLEGVKSHKVRYLPAVLRNFALPTRNILFLKRAMADTKVKAAPKKSTATKGTLPAAKRQGQGKAVPTPVPSPTPCMPGTDSARRRLHRAATRRRPRPQQPTFPKETYLQLVRADAAHAQV